VYVKYNFVNALFEDWIHSWKVVVFPSVAPFKATIIPDVKMERLEILTFDFKPYDLGMDKALLTEYLKVGRDP
jgi:hypothetical protein